jgi:O-methyltransferase
MSARRDLVAALLPAGIPGCALVRDNADFVKMRTERFSECPEFAKRDDLYRHVASDLDEPIDYVEFGVRNGGSIRRWTELNKFPHSRFFGFDTFEGLPEDWKPGYGKGSLSTGGIPEITDSRVTLAKGLFQDTLYPFLATTILEHRLVLNLDCDLYSSSLFAITAMDRQLQPGARILLDDFYTLPHQFRAFADWDRAFHRNWRAIGRMSLCRKVAIEIA